MVKGILTVLTVGALACVGFVIYEKSLSTSIEAQEQKRPERAEAILQEFFSEEFAQHRIGHMALSKLQSVEPVAQPRPRIADIVARYGEPDSPVVEVHLGRFGLRGRGFVSYYERLGLVAPSQSPDAEVFWVLITAVP